MAGHLEERLLDPERLEEILASVLDRRQGRAKRRHEHVAELNRRAAEADARLRRLYGAIESGVAKLNDPAVKERIEELKATRDQAQADAQRASQGAEGLGASSTPAHVAAFAREARQRIIAATYYVRSPSASKSPSAKSESWERRAIYCGLSPPQQA